MRSQKQKRQCAERMDLVSDSDGVVLVDRKFHKADFLKIMNDPECKPYILELFDAAFIRKKRTVEESDKK